VVELVPVSADDAEGELFAIAQRADRMVQRDGRPTAGTGGCSGFREQGISGSGFGEELNVSRVGARTIKIVLQGKRFPGHQGMVEVLTDLHTRPDIQSLVSMRTAGSRSYLAAISCGQRPCGRQTGTER